eukprot:1134694-Pelagomonas_calceolata.AAC.1
MCLGIQLWSAECSSNIYARALPDLVPCNLLHCAPSLPSNDQYHSRSLTQEHVGVAFQCVPVLVHVVLDHQHALQCRRLKVRCRKPSQTCSTTAGSPSCFPSSSAAIAASFAAFDGEHATHHQGYVKKLICLRAKRNT